MTAGPPAPATAVPFACRGCGTCCRWPGHVLLTAGDLARLAEALQLTEERFIACYTRLAANRAQLSLTDGAGTACVFLEQGRCRVYAARPEQCRQFPRGWSVAGGCPGESRLPPPSALPPLPE